MQTISIVTGNPGKVAEIEAMANGQLDFVMHDLDLTEIQSMDLQEIVRAKARSAYDKIRGPVIVEDVSAGLESWQGLPGPFIKFFIKKLGADGLYKLGNGQHQRATITCLAAYYDGERELYGEGTIHCDVVAPRGSNGFGFDPIMVPDGQTKTMAEMSPEEKRAISHRGLAFRALLNQLAR
ncbi:MAG: rdgB [Candidatus Saccharibacteria bacterium]|nr:rdgB [Candidatus Saccharibacteria bacterium]